MLDKIIKDIEKQGWSTCEDIVDQKALKQIQQLFNEDFLPAKIGKGENKNYHAEVRGDLIQWIDILNPSPLLEPYLNIIQNLKNQLNQNFFLGIKDFECHLAKYPVGSFYKKHLDRFSNDSSRVFSFIFYLHEEWEDNNGGELVLYDKKNTVLKIIDPRPGTLVCFLSDEFPHEVLVSKKERRSLTGWMHTKILN